jgi:hypothetical protein
VRKNPLSDLWRLAAIVSVFMGAFTAEVVAFGDYFYICVGIFSDY